MTHSLLYASIVLVAVLETTAHAQPGLGRVDPLLAKSPDLVAVDVDINDAGDLVVVLNNRGLAVTTPFVAELHVDGHTRRTLSFTGAGPAARTPPRGDGSMNLTLPLRQNETRTLLVKNLDVGVCSGNHNLKVLLDPAAAVGEAYENNNEKSRNLAAPCPDLIVASIGKNYNSTRTQYVAEVVVLNQGTGTTPGFSIAASAESGAVPSLPGGGLMPFAPLAPGKTMKFTLGVAQSFESLRVEVRLDVGNVVKESNEENNFTKKLLSP